MYGENMYGERNAYKGTNLYGEWAGKEETPGGSSQTGISENPVTEDQSGDPTMAAGASGSQTPGAGSDGIFPAGTAGSLPPGGSVGPMYSGAGPAAGQPAGSPYPAGMGVPVRVIPERKNGEKLENMLNRFAYFGIGCLVWGLVFVICIYPGFHGISVPVLSVLTMAGLVQCCKALEVQLKKSAWFYFLSWFVLSISSTLTGSRPILAFNTCGMFLLFLTFLFTHFCRTENWGFGKYMGQIFLAPFLATSYLLSPFRSLERYTKQREKGKSPLMRHIWLGIVISLPLLFVLTCLLMSADAVFRSLFTELFRNIRFPRRPFWMCFLLFVGIFGSYSLLAYFADGRIEDKVTDRKKWEPVVGISFLSVITLLYLIFSVIQISCLFLGGFRLPEGYSYSSYAREGFFQLLAVCLINLAIVLLCLSRFRTHPVLKGVLTVFSCCTFIMIASSAMRMLLYVGMHHLTFLRLLVLWALALITVLLSGCIVTIYKPHFPLFQFAMVTVTVFYIGFSLARPDYHIIRYNLSHDRYAQSSDEWYWFELSSDAIPVMAQEGVLEKMGWRPDLPPQEMGWQEEQLQEKLDAYREMGIRDFNFSYYTAGKILDAY